MTPRENLIALIIEDYVNDPLPDKFPRYFVGENLWLILCPHFTPEDGPWEIVLALDIYVGLNKDD